MDGQLSFLAELLPKPPRLWFESENPVMRLRTLALARMRELAPQPQQAPRGKESEDDEA